MRNRIMRTIVFFDLPTISLKDRKNYMKFRKMLIREGFIMMQESVYSKMVLNSIQSNLLIEKIRKMSPSNGVIQVLTLTEKQYSQITYIIGDVKTKIIDSDERLV